MHPDNPSAASTRAVWLLSVALCALALAIATTARAADSVSGRPTRVLGGDRLILLGNDGRSHLVRLAGIITPPPNQHWGAAARRQLGSLVMGRSVTVFYQGEQPEGEIIGYLRHGGADVNLRMLQAGLARLDPKSLTREAAIRYAEAERRARQGGIGAWSETPGEHTPGYRAIPGGPLFRSEN